MPISIGMSHFGRILAAAASVAALALPAAADARAGTTYYVGLGDSYSQGAQPIGPGQSDETTDRGFNDFAYKKLHRSHRGLELVKLGCGGATTDSMIHGTKGCHEDLPYRSNSRATSQLSYAVRWIRTHRHRVRYVTVSIGGNDFAHCIGAGDLDAVDACMTQGIEQMKENLPVIARDLRAAAGRKVVIVGSTYPDVVLGQYVRNSQGRQFAQASVSLFRDQVNPVLKSAYAKRKIRFADTTAGFGGYIPFDTTTTLAPFGRLPVAVANICRLGWYCQVPDIHLRSSGYRRFAAIVLKQLRHR